MTVKIGILNTPFAKAQGIHTQAELERFGVQSTLSFFEKNSTLEAAVLRGDVDVAAQHLSTVALQKSEGLAVTALSARKHPADVLLMKKAAFDTNMPFRIKENARILCFSPIQQAQLQHFRTDLICTEDAALHASPLDAVSSDSIDAVFVAAAELEVLDFDKSAFATMELFPKEIIPAAGQGVTAWQVNAKDIPTRRLFKKLHHSAVSKATNIERKIVQSLEQHGYKAAVFCDKDHRDNLHVSAVCTSAQGLKRFSTSATTHLGMAERVIQGLLAVEV